MAAAQARSYRGAHGYLTCAFESRGDGYGRLYLRRSFSLALPMSMATESRPGQHEMAPLRPTQISPGLLGSG